MATLNMEPRNLEQQPKPAEPELNLLLKNDELDEPLYRRLARGIDEFFFPKKLPPLVLTSKPVPVKDIWGFYNNKGKGALGSTVIHLLALAAIIAGTVFGYKKVVEPKKDVTILVAPSDDLPTLKPSKTQVGGGGGGGDRDKLQTPKGKLPKEDLQQITPPAMVVRNEHPKLTAEPTVVVPPQVKLANNNLPMLGDPMSHLPSGPPSNGTGSGGGIGAGNGGGIGTGSGPGYGPGYGGGTGGGIFRVGGGVSAPKMIYDPDPEYSEEARKAKYQGTCVLMVVVGTDGKVHDVKVARSLGLGLDEKAIEAVKTWRFEPAQKDGKPVAVAVNIEVNFHLY